MLESLKKQISNILNWILEWDTNPYHYEYVDNVGSTLFGSGWTAPHDGIMVIRAQWNNAHGSGYVYTADNSDGGRYVSCLSTTYTNQFSQSNSFPVIKGHTYGISAANAVLNYDANFYKLVGGVPLSCFFKAFSHLQKIGGGVSGEKYKDAIGQAAQQIVRKWYTIFQFCSYKYHKHGHRHAYEWSKSDASSWDLYYSGRVALPNKDHDRNDQHANSTKKWSDRFNLRDEQSVRRGSQLELITNDDNDSAYSRNNGLCMRLIIKTDNQYNRSYKLDQCGAYKVAISERRRTA